MRIFLELFEAEYIILKKNCMNLKAKYFLGGIAYTKAKNIYTNVKKTAQKYHQ